jgi:hypothetical protein
MAPVKSAWRSILVVGVWVLAADVVLQFLFAGLLVFVDRLGYYSLHAELNPIVIFFLPLILVLAGWRAGLPVRTRWLLASMSVLVALQSVLLIGYHLDVQGPIKLLAGLHAVNALLIFWVAVQVLDRTREWADATVAA